MVQGQGIGTVKYPIRILPTKFKYSEKNDKGNISLETAASRSRTVLSSANSVEMAARGEVPVASPLATAMVQWECQQDYETFCTSESDRFWPCAIRGSPDQLFH